jgi:hypothetical protein
MIELGIWLLLFYGCFTAWNKMLGSHQVMLGSLQFTRNVIAWACVVFKAQKFNVKLLKAKCVAILKRGLVTNLLELDKYNNGRFIWGGGGYKYIFAYFSTVLSVFNCNRHILISRDQLLNKVRVTQSFVYQSRNEEKAWHLTHWWRQDLKYTTFSKTCQKGSFKIHTVLAGRNKKS